ncbi:MAG: leucine-rich repeat protein [Candidatus Methanomethylophilaceae archaeon]|nr:leucine-rich repeat protein [Candidatus Methanomethylophilaceae archaeon]
MFGKKGLLAVALCVLMALVSASVAVSDESDAFRTVDSGFVQTIGSDPAAPDPYPVGYEFTSGGVVYRVIDRSGLVAACGHEDGIRNADIPRYITIDGGKFIVDSVKSKAFYGCDTLESVTIDASEVKNRAFCNCTGLKTVSFGTACTSIEECAFYSCSSLERAAFLSQSVFLGEKAFCRCTSLKEMSFESCCVSLASTNALYSTKFYDGSTLLAKNTDNLSFRKFVGSDSVLYLDLDPFQVNSVIYKPSSTSTATVIGYDPGIVSPSIPGLVDFEGSSYTVTGIDSKAFYGCDTLMTLYYGGEGAIGDKAFARCTSLYYVVAVNVSSIGDYAFFRCPITYIHLGSGANGVSLGQSAFSYCNLFEIVNFEKIASVGKNAFYGTVFYAPDAKTELAHDAGILSDKIFYLTNGKLVCETYEGYEFESGGVIYEVTAKKVPRAKAVGHVEEVTDIVIGDHVQCGPVDYTVERVANRAFYGCGTLETASISTDIGERAFTKCTSLSELRLNCDTNSRIAIGVAAFYGCTGLRTAEFGNIADIGKSAFYQIKFYDGDDLLSSTPYNLSGNRFVGSGSVLHMHFDPFFYDGVYYSPQNSYEAIATGRGASTDIVIQDYAYNDKGREFRVIGVNDKAFYSDKALTSVDCRCFGAIGERAFANCSSLDSLAIDGELRAVGIYAFFGCAKLDTVLLPDTVETVGKSAFSKCYGLEEFALFNGSATMGENALYGLTLRYADGSPLPLGSVPGHRLTGVGNRILTANLADGDVLTKDGVLYKVHIGAAVGATAIGFVEGITEARIADLEIGGYHMVVEGVGSRAFLGCDTLVSLTVQSGTIGNKAFYECSSLSEVDITGVSSIGEYAFYKCKAINEIEINAQSIGKSAFSECTGLKRVAFGDVQQFGENAFYRCKFYENTTSTEPITDMSKLPGYLFTGKYSKLVKNPKDGTEYEIGDVRYLVISNADRTVAFKKCLGSSNVYQIPSTVSIRGFTFTVTTVMDQAFNGGLEALTIPLSISTIEPDAFSLVKIDKLTFSRDICAELNDIELYDLDGNLIDTESGIKAGTYEGYDSILHRVPSIGDEFTSEMVRYRVIDLDEVEAIGYNGGYFVVNSIVDVGDRSFSLTRVAEDAFSGASISDTHLERVTVLGDRAFMNANLYESRLNLLSVEEIGEDVFQGCYSVGGIAFSENLRTVSADSFVNVRFYASYDDEANGIEIDSSVASNLAGHGFERSSVLPGQFIDMVMDK